MADRGEPALGLRAVEPLRIAPEALTASHQHCIH